MGMTTKEFNKKVAQVDILIEVATGIQSMITEMSNTDDLDDEIKGIACISFEAAKHIILEKAKDILEEITP